MFLSGANIPVEVANAWDNRVSLHNTPCPSHKQLKHVEWPSKKQEKTTKSTKTCYLLQNTELSRS